MIRTRKQSGDTIVEVLIAMAIASLILGGAYAVTQRSLANARQAQEQSEALKLVQEQVEGLKALYSTHSAALTTGGDDCIKGGAVVAAASCNNEGSVGYRLSIQYRSVDPGVAAANNPPATFIVTAIWPSATGNGDSKVTQAYRVVL